MGLEQEANEVKNNKYTYTTTKYTQHKYPTDNRNSHLYNSEELVLRIGPPLFLKKYRQRLDIKNTGNKWHTKKNIPSLLIKNYI